MKKLLIFLFLLIACPAWGADCGGVTACNCGDTVTSSYTLTGDLSCTNVGNGLNVGANNITIDLGGYTIDGDDSNTVTGIDNNGHTTVVIQNGTITDFTKDGIQYRGASSGTVNNMACNSIGNQGFQMEGNSSVVYNNITANNNTDDGFSMHGGTAVINGGTFTGNSQAINTVATDSTATLTAYDIIISASTLQDIFHTDSKGTITANYYRVSIDKTGGGFTVPSVQYHGNNVSGVINGLTISNVPEGESGGLVNVSVGAHLGLKNAYLYGNALNTSGVGVLIAGTGANLTQYLGGVVANFKYGIDPFDTTQPINVNNVVFRNITTAPIMIRAAVVHDIFGCSFQNITGHIIDNNIAGATVNINYSKFIGMGASKFGICCRANTICNIYNNTFYDSNKDGNGIFAIGTTTAKNNLFMTLANAITRSSGTPTVDHNLFYDITTKFTGTVTSTNEVTTDPLLVDASNNNYHLQSGSPARGAGVNVGLSNTNPPDIGAEPYVQYVPWR
jgi:hypothetical protein